ncbi:MAG: nuclear transport factor 2 family protein [Acidimicrobiales bacterium]
MTEDRFDDGGLLARLRQLEDVEAIRRLKAAYCAGCDDDHDGDAVAALFAPDGVWHDTRIAPCEGHAAIKAHFGAIRASGRIARSSHMVTNPVIDVDGDTATGRWSLLMQYTDPADRRWRIVGFYRDTYERYEGIWRFRRLEAYVQDYSCLHAEGA